MSCMTSDGKETIARAYALAMKELGRSTGVTNIELTKCVMTGILDLATTGQSDPVQLAHYAVLRCQLLVDAKALHTEGPLPGKPASVDTQKLTEKLYQDT